MVRNHHHLVLLVSTCALVTFGVITLTPGCDRQARHRNQNDDAAFEEPSVISQLADAFVEGTNVNDLAIRAERFDPVTQIIHDVRIDGRDAMIRAERAEIVIDEEARTARITLIDVVIAHLPHASNEEGEIEQFDTFDLEPIPIGE